MSTVRSSRNISSSKSVSHTRSHQELRTFRSVLYNNLNHSLANLYAVCEQESNGVECVEVLNVLDKAATNFHQLYESIRLLERTDPNKTKSVSWNVSAIPADMKATSGISWADYTSEEEMDFNAVLRPQRPFSSSASPQHGVSSRRVNMLKIPIIAPVGVRAAVKDDVEATTQNDQENVISMPRPDEEEDLSLPVRDANAVQTLENEDRAKPNDAAATPNQQTETVDELDSNELNPSLILSIPEEPSEVLECKQESEHLGASNATECASEQLTSAVSKPAQPHENERKQLNRVPVLRRTDASQTHRLDRRQRERTAQEEECNVQEPPEASKSRGKRVFAPAHAQMRSYDSTAPRPQSSHSDSPPLTPKSDSLDSSQFQRKRQSVWCTSQSVSSKISSPRAESSGTSDGVSSAQRTFSQIVAATESKHSHSTNTIHFPQTQFFPIRNQMGAQGYPLIYSAHSQQYHHARHGYPNQDPSHHRHMEHARPTKIFANVEPPSPRLLFQPVQHRQSDGLPKKLQTRLKLMKKGQQPRDIALHKVLEKQDNAERNRQRLQQERRQKWTVVSTARKKRLQDNLQKQEDARRRKENEFSQRMTNANRRYQSQLSAKRRRVKAKQERFAVSARHKNEEEEREREKQRAAQEARMADAHDRHVKTIEEKAGKAKQENNKLVEVAFINQHSQTFEAEDKMKSFEQKLHDSQERRNQILAEIKQKSNENAAQSKAVLKRKRKIVKKQADAKKQKKRGDAHLLPPMLPKRRKKRSKRKRPSSRTESESSAVVDRSYVRHSVASFATDIASSMISEAEETLRHERAEHLRTLLTQSANEFCGNRMTLLHDSPSCPLRTKLRHLSRLSQKLYVKLSDEAASKKMEEIEAKSNGVLVESESVGNQLLGELETFSCTESTSSFASSESVPRPNGSSRHREQDRTLESPLKDILKLLDSREVSDVSYAKLLMFLVDTTSRFLSFWDQLSDRATKAIARCIEKCVHRNVHVGAHILQSSSLLNLFDWFIAMMMDFHSRKRQIIAEQVIPILHALIVAVDRADDEKHIAQKTLFLRYLCVSGFFRKMVKLFSGMVSHCAVPLSHYYPLLLRIVPLITAVTAYDNHLMVQPVFEDKNAPEEIVVAMKETNICALFSLMSALTLEQNPDKRSWETAWQQDLPDDTVVIISSCLESINNFARIDLRSFQEMMEVMRMELYHVLSFLLAYVTYHYPKRRQTRVLCNQIILFMGYCAVNNSVFQECFRWGKHPNLLKRLCNLPFNYFNQPKKMEILIPTLLAVTFGQSASVRMMSADVSLLHLMHFLEEHVSESSRTNPVAVLLDAKDPRPDLNSSLLSLACRFPRELWSEALTFYGSHC